MLPFGPRLNIFRPISLYSKDSANRSIVPDENL